MRVSLFRRRGIRLALALLFGVLSGASRARASARRSRLLKAGLRQAYRLVQIPIRSNRAGHGPQTRRHGHERRFAKRRLTVSPSSARLPASITVTATRTRASWSNIRSPTLPQSRWFHNFPWFTDAELISAVKSSVPLFDGTAPDHGTLLDDISDALQFALASRNVHTSVTHALVTVPGGSKRFSNSELRRG